MASRSPCRVPIRSGAGDGDGKGLWGMREERTLCRGFGNGMRETSERRGKGQRTGDFRKRGVNVGI